MTGDEYRKQDSIPGANDPVGRGINIEDETFWFEVTDADGYVWDLLGRFRELSGDIAITEIRVGAADEANLGPKQLNPDLHRRLTRIQPIKTRIRRQIKVEVARFKEAVHEGKESGLDVRVLEEMAKRLADTQRQLKPWRSRYPDSDWAKWALDYLKRVRAKQSTYDVLPEIAEQQAWGNAEYEAVRARIRKMRDHEWVIGEGHLVEEGPRLLRWLDERKDQDDG